MKRIFSLMILVVFAVLAPCQLQSQGYSQSTVKVEYYESSNGERAIELQTATLGNEQRSFLMYYYGPEGEGRLTIAEINSAVGTPSFCKIGWTRDSRSFVYFCRYLDGKSWVHRFFAWDALKAYYNDGDWTKHGTNLLGAPSGKEGYKDPDQWDFVQLKTKKNCFADLDLEYIANDEFIPDNPLPPFYIDKDNIIHYSYVRWFPYGEGEFNKYKSCPSPSVPEGFKSCSWAGLCVYDVKQKPDGKVVSTKVYCKKTFGDCQRQ